MNDVLTPAATDKSNVSGETWDAISVKTPGRTCGFTARTTTSETRATSPLDASACEAGFLNILFDDGAGGSVRLDEGRLGGAAAEGLQPE